METRRPTDGKILGPSGPIARLALSEAEAAKALGVSIDYFEEHVMPELRLVRRGRHVLVPTRELERWLDLSSARLFKAG